MHGVWWLKTALGALLLGLMGYVVVGYTTVPFHGDEADHLHKSHDFVVALVKGHPADLRVTPPVAIDSTEHIRLLTGTTHAYLTGYALWSMGVYDANWPRAWNYAQDVAWNIEYGRRPTERVLQRGRLPHVVLTLFSVPLAFGIVWRWRPSYPYTAASLAAVLVATHPAWLLNGRRAMQEAALVTLSLVLIMLGMSLAERMTTSKWGLLALLSALCVAAKPTGLITVGAIFIALGWIALAVPPRQRHIGQLVLAGLGALGLYVLFTPPIWGNPPARVVLAAQLRADVLAGQTAASSQAYATSSDRLVGLLRQPFLESPQYFESDAFEGALDDQIHAYERAGWAGWRMGQGIAWVATGCGLLGLLQLSRQWRDPVRRVGVVWLWVTPLTLLVSVPLGWQRYYLLWSVEMCLLAPLGVMTVFKWLNGYRYFWR